MLLFLTCVLRLTVIATGNYEQIQLEQLSYKIDVSNLRGTIYDCNMMPLTNTKEQIVAVVTPSEQGIKNISKILDGEQLNVVLNTLKNNNPAVCIVNEEIYLEGIATTKIFNRYSNNIACHLIGYIDDTGHGVNGLERAYDELLYSDKKVRAVFNCDGKGNILKGIEPFFENDMSIVFDGVVSTIDINIQKIVEEISSDMTSGCIVVADANNSKIKAMVSVPSYDINDISKSLNSANSPLLNRALCSFNIGSIFKPCVAISILENNRQNILYNCEGNMIIGDRTFRCHNLSGHGQVSLCDSLAQSCNCFFYNYSTKFGGDEIYKNVSKLSWGAKIKIADNFYASIGNLPSKVSLENSGTLANFSIGQGALMASPIAMLNLYTAIATDGSYYIPSVVERTIKDGKETTYDIGSPTIAMQSETAAELRECLKKVITDGTGAQAKPQKTTAAGKTATAQTGRFLDDGSEITNSWFCGFFPADNPRYVVVVMSDSKQNISTASLFAKIADGISEYIGITVENND